MLSCPLCTPLQALSVAKYLLSTKPKDSTLQQMVDTIGARIAQLNDIGSDDSGDSDDSGSDFADDESDEGIGSD